MRWVPWPPEEDPLTEEEAIDGAARALVEGSILAHPTSTVYGLGGRPDAINDARLARLKGRKEVPLIVLAADREAIASSVPGLVWTALAERLADAFWPGPLTLVLEGRDGVGRAVRVDSHPSVTAVLNRTGGVMTSTSLNATGAEPARSRKDVLRAIDALSGPLEPFGWLDAGDLPVSLASTLVRVADDRIEVLREGAISRLTLEAIS